MVKKKLHERVPAVEGRGAHCSGSQGAPGTRAGLWVGRKELSELGLPLSFMVIFIVSSSLGVQFQECNTDPCGRVGTAT